MLPAASGAESTPSAPTVAVIAPSSLATLRRRCWTSQPAAGTAFPALAVETDGNSGDTRVGGNSGDTILVMAICAA